ncbi:hypothetical protein BDD43_3963 [Mucilaginibacter gracilis]|uniref:Uncharacterized protein n=1 Tax=Mucilaginibacter gracilis TaxID=423350 RepID=A0A495J6V6_9SPHI|nr:hypothetical protein [Mucilaginibacter gracilis]RKR83749.1 hypothetical protein BDD43_3963 [Mucilaginibacter gracilis]
MKKIILIAALVINATLARAQWTTASTAGNYSLPTGNAGIGTTAPATKLHVLVYNDGLNITTGLQNQSSNQNGGTAVGIGFLNECCGSWWKAAIVHERTNAYGVGSLKFLVSGTTDASTVSLADTKMTILPSGNVGIGTTGPDQKLTVNGTIHSTQVKVDLNMPAPDYVFNTDYNLINLNELKNYVAKYHHLPEIPSAAQMAKNGIDLGDMNTILLKKVEELTLYLIEKEQQIKEIKETQQNENQKLQEQLKIMQDQLRNIISKKTKYLKKKRFTRR